MNFDNIFLSNDINAFGSDYLNQKQSYKNQNSLLSKSKLILKMVIVILIVLIIIIILKYIELRKLTIINNEQQFYNQQQIGVNQDFAEQNELLLQKNNKRKKEINDLQEIFIKESTIYKSLTTQSEEENEMIQKSLQDQINEGKKKSEILRMKRRDIDQSLIIFNAKRIEKQSTKQKLLKTIEGLEKELFLNDNEFEREGPYGSNLIRTEKDIALLTKGLGRKFKIRLLYRGTHQKNSLMDYLNAVSDENINNTLVVMKIKNGPIIGGFSYNNWSHSGFNNDDYAFLFNLSSEMIFKIHNTKEAIYVDYHTWPIFGAGDLTIVSFNTCTSEFPHSYGNEIEDSKYSLTDDKRVFQIEILEVFVLYANNN